MEFTENIKKDLVTWVESSRGVIKGADELYRQIAIDGEVNPGADNGHFFQTQVLKQLIESGKYNKIEIEDKGSINGIKYDVDITLDNHIYIQTWYGENVFGYMFRKTIHGNPFNTQLRPVKCSLYNDYNKRQKKLTQLDKPQLVLSKMSHDSNIVKILVVAPRTGFPLLSLPEWKHQLEDRVMVELRGDFDNNNNLKGDATLHRLQKQHDEITSGLVGAMGFRCVESFNDTGMTSTSKRFGVLPVNTWQYCRC